ncbi:MAG: cell envelope integrity protein TolA [Gammaproteobacteria bacterium]|nr:MAG: cell envelope integrity protein TolA [Gammaproteobacteria bacterium]
MLPSFLLALAVHGALAALLVVSLDWTPRPAAPRAAPAPVQAVVVDERRVQEEMRRLAEAEQAKERAEAERLRRLREEAERAKRRAEQERRRLERLQRERAKRQAELRRRQREAERERRRLAELRKRREAEKRRLAKLEAERRRQEEARQRAEAERRKRLEAERRRKAEEERRRKAEAERRRKLEAERRRREAEEALKRQLAEEEARLAAERRARQELARYMALIKQKVERSWTRPPTWRAGMACEVKVRLLPSGDVAEVQILASTGDRLSDRSVTQAVYQAAPLPLPKDPALRGRFREIRFVFKPKA